MDPRKKTSKFYDAFYTSFNDAAFYLERIEKLTATEVLELGCGTGRVFIHLAKVCKKLVGVDYSQEMLDQCNDKLKVGKAVNAQTLLGDITNLSLGTTFDLIIAPFRVLQALEKDEEVNGFFESIARHMKPSGRGIINVFKPKLPADELRKHWCQSEESISQEITLEDGSRLVCSDLRKKMDRENLILYPDIIYRKYVDDALVEEVIHPIKMRCYYPEDLIQLIKDKGFSVTECWGGYNNENYGEGPELVVEFKR